MLEPKSQPQDRFVIIPSSVNKQVFFIYDSLLEQVIGTPHASLQDGMNMAAYLNRTTPIYS